MTGHLQSPRGRSVPGPLARLLPLHGLAARLLVTQIVVLSAGLGTAWLVAVIVAPPLFRKHLEQENHAKLVPELVHIEDAFASASLIASAVALAVAILVALAVSIYLTRRIQRPLSALTAAAGSVASGRRPRVLATGIGPEFDSLAQAFNSMAETISLVEDTRRRLLSDLAHEMRTPVSTIEGYLEGLEDRVVEWDDDTARVMREQTGRLIRLIEDIDDVSQAEEGRLQLDPALTPVTELLETAVTSARHQFTRKGVNLVQDESGTARDQVVLVDRQRMGQALANVLSNALRHTAAGGLVTVTSWPAANAVGIAVEDTGEGIEAQHLPHVFERFFRGDSARDRDHGGAGIGLAISRAIVEGHGGTIAVESEGRGSGARFTVMLPAGK